MLDLSQDLQVLAGVSQVSWRRFIEHPLHDYSPDPHRPEVGEALARLLQENKNN